MPRETTLSDWPKQEWAELSIRFESSGIFQIGVTTPMTNETYKRSSAPFKKRSTPLRHNLHPSPETTAANSN